MSKKKKEINKSSCLLMNFSKKRISNLAYPATKHFLLRVKYTEDKILPLSLIKCKHVCRLMPRIQAVIESLDKCRCFLGDRKIIKIFVHFPRAYSSELIVSAY